MARAACGHVIAKALAQHYYSSATALPEHCVRSDHRGNLGMSKTLRRILGKEATARVKERINGPSQSYILQGERSSSDFLLRAHSTTSVRTS